MCVWSDNIVLVDENEFEEQIFEIILIYLVIFFLSFTSVIYILYGPSHPI